MKFKREWEQVTETTFRMKVPGGWIICDETINPDGTRSASICNVPDPNHEWELTPKNFQEEDKY